MRLNNIVINEQILLEIGNRYLKVAALIDNNIICVKKTLFKGVNNGVITDIDILQTTIIELITDLEFEIGMHIKYVSILISIGNILIKEHIKQVYPNGNVSAFLLEQYIKELYLSELIILNIKVIYTNANNQIISNPINMYLKQLNIYYNIIYCDIDILANLNLIFNNLKYQIIDISYASFPLLFLQKDVLDIGYRYTNLITNNQIYSFNFGINKIYQALSISYFQNEINLSIKFNNNIDIVNTTRYHLQSFLNTVNLPINLYLTGGCLFIPFFAYYLSENYYIKAAILDLNLKNVTSDTNHNAFVNLVEYAKYLQEKEEISLFGLSLSYQK